MTLLLAWGLVCCFDYLRVHAIHIYLSKLNQFSGEENIIHNSKSNIKIKNRIKNKYVDKNMYFY
jgi:hypothetical protein